MTLKKKIKQINVHNITSKRRLAGLWRLLSGHRLMYLGAVLGVGLAAVFKTGNYLLLRYLVDDVLIRERFAHVLPLIALGFIGLALAQGLFSYISGTLAARTAETIARQLRNYLYDHIQRLSFTYHDQANTGDIIQRATSDVDAVRRFFADQAIGLGRIVLLFAVNFVALLNLNTTLGLVSVIVALPIVVVSVFFFKRISDAYERFQEREAELSSTLQENLTGVRVVKAFARQAYEINKFDEKNRNQYQAGRVLMKFHSMFWPSTDILCGFQTLLGMLVGALMAIDGRITVGTYVAYTGLVIWVIWPLRNLGRIIVHISTGMVSFGRLAELIKEEREPMAEGTYRPKDAPQGEVVYDNVCFRYDGEQKDVLKAISFRCRPGEVTALIGSTGSGKTSLVNLLPRFYEVTEGRLTLDGRRIDAYPRRYLRQQIGIVEQEPFLFSRTIRENICYGVEREVPDEEIASVAHAAAIHDVILTFPKQYETKIGEKGVTLSGGQKQRIAIARTLLKDPRILILDDATSSVDTETEGEIRAALNRLMEGRTTFIIAHRIQSVMNADQILVLDDGKIVQRGRHAELLAQDGAYREIYDLQARIEDELLYEAEDGESTDTSQAARAVAMGATV